MTTLWPETTSTRDAVPDSGRLTLLWTACVAAVALHNIEEWLLDMTGWMGAREWLPGSSLHGDQGRYAVALVIVTLALLGVAILAVVSRAGWSAEVLTCVGYVLLANAASHLLLSVVAGSIMPGAVTGALVLMPLGLVVLHTLPPVRWTLTTTATTILAALVFVGGSLALAGVLTALT